MAVTAVDFDHLPTSVRTAVEAETGRILKAETISVGLNSALSARLHTATGIVFLKGLPTDHRWVWTQQREADINPYVVPLAPRLLFHVVTDGWDVLGFEAIEGHHADYSPGSSDLAKLLVALQELSTIPCPAIELRRAEQRLANYVDNPADAELFEGDALLHTDWNNHNVLVTDDRAHLVDWGWATRGAPWLDAAYWIIWLIAAGHTPESAEACVAQVPSWHTASPHALKAFARANVNVWTGIAGDSPDTWTEGLLTAARRWQQHRSPWSENSE